MNALNRTILVGKLMKAPYVNETSNGRKVARVLLVVQRPGRGSSANIQLVDWGDDWGASQSNPKSREGITLADLEGDTSVRIEGELITRSYQPEGAAKATFSTEVDVRSIQVLDADAYRAFVREATVEALT